MAVVCAACGTENRDKARFCRGCAQPLVPLAPGAVPTALAQERRSRSRARRKAAARAAAPWWKHPAAGWSVAAVLALGGLVAWWSLPGAQVPAAAAPVSAPVPPLTAPASDPVISAPTAPLPSPAAEPTVTASSPVPAPAAGSAPLAGETVRATAAPVVTRGPRTPKPRAETSPPTAPVETPAASRQPPTPAPPAETAPPAVSAARTPTVDERCADRSNFLSRDICRIQACGNPALAADPVCVRFREMEAANRERLDN